MLETDDLARAGEELGAAVALAPADRWANFYYGIWSYRTGRPTDAVAAFSVCIGAAPDVAGCYYNRALAYAAVGRPDEALADYDRALRLDPTYAAALLNRGMLHFEQRRNGDAIADLTLALQHGADPATVHYDLALIRAASGDRATALAEARAAVQANPAHERAARLCDTLQHEIPAATTGK
jgi:tetratricopeptide (TPR) repeat protein